MDSFDYDADRRTVTPTETAARLWTAYRPFAPGRGAIPMPEAACVVGY